MYLLNLSRSDPNGSKMIGGRQLDATGTDMISSIQTRLSMQSRRSTDPHRRMSVSSQHGDREGLIRAYDEEEMAGFGLTDLAEESDSDDDSSQRRLNGTVGGENGGKHEGDAIELQERRKDDR